MTDAWSATEWVLALAVMNVVTFLLFAWDKKCAEANTRRIPESTLLGAALMGGSPGGYLAMQLLRHKTRKQSFLWRMYAIMAGQIILIIVLL